MKFCQPHWNALRTAIDERGLSGLVAKDGVVATQQMAAQLQGAPEAETFDPLMSAHWAIVGNVSEFMERGGASGFALWLLTGDYCPLCEINQAHERTCTDPDCKLDRQAGYDWMIARAAEDSLSRAREFGLAPGVQ